MTAGKRLYKRCLAANKLGRLVHCRSTPTSEQGLLRREHRRDSVLSPPLPTCVIEAYARGRDGKPPWGVENDT
jgi:hypothetical protein